MAQAKGSSSSGESRSEFLSPICEVAREAGALLMDFFRQRVKVEYKGDVDVVTAADRASEKLIFERIRSRWPKHNLMGEEGTRTEQGSDYRWYVDPLDGTTNFAHGYPVFCVSIALEFQGELITGVIFDPTRNELYTAERGRGAFLDGEKIHVSSVSRLAESLLATGFPSQKRHKNPNIYFYHQITLKTHGVRRAGSAALDLAAVACGRFDGFWEFNLNPWDTAAGVLLVEEAGGQVSGFTGQPFEINSRETLASNGLIHAELLREFDAVFRGEGLEQLPSVEEYVRTRES